VTKAQQQLAALVEWVKASSCDRMAPLGKARIVYGPYAVFVPQSLALAPGPTFAPEHLPLWLPEQQSIPGLPPFTHDPQPGQGPASSRLRHIVWCWMDARFQGGLLGMTDPEEPLQNALGRQLPAFDLNENSPCSSRSGSSPAKIERGSNRSCLS
jgi:hypothetical protein